MRNRARGSPAPCSPCPVRPPTVHNVPRRCAPTRPTQAVNNNTKLTWTAAPNGFTDMTDAELALRLIPGPKRPKSASAAAALRAARPSARQIAAMAPPEITVSPEAMAAAAAAHRAAGTVGAASEAGAAAVTPEAVLQGTPDWSSLFPAIKNQGDCASCW